MAVCLKVEPCKAFVSRLQHWFNEVLYRVFALFWGLTMYDIYVPKGSYENELLRIKRLIATLQENVEIVWLLFSFFLIF